MKRIFAFPCACAGASYFRTWQDQFDANIDFIPIQLPGRENRFAEPRIEDMTLLIPDLFEAIQPHLDKPYVFFGHSLGALIAFELAMAIQKQGLFLPDKLIVAAYGAPHLKSDRQSIHHLSDQEFSKKLVAMDGMPTEITANKELLQLLTPIAKSDFKLHETYRYLHQRKLSCPIRAMGGKRDPFVSIDQIQRWQEVTYEVCDIGLIEDGNHYFIHEKRDEIVDFLKK